MATLTVRHCTHGSQEAERATLAFVVGNVAASADQDVVVLLTIEGVWLATKGCADGVHKDGFQPLREVMQSFTANGGQIWAGGACAKPRRDHLDADLIPGARIVTAAMAVERLAGGERVVEFLGGSVR